MKRTPAPPADGPAVLLDRRRPAARWLDVLWRREPPPAWARWADQAAAPLRRAVLARRRQGRGRPPNAALVLSVGSLAVGGAGKTPVVLALAGELARRGWAGAVVTRGYPSRQRGPLRVAPDDAGAGDEARLIAAVLPPSWPVIQAADRAAGLAAALALDPPPAVVLLEDAHQSAAVPRHGDIVLLDRWRRDGAVVAPRGGLALPWGPWREGPEAAAGADVWLLELPPGDDGAWLARARPAAAGGGSARPAAPRLLGFRRRARLPAAAPLAAGAAYGAVCGIARPSSFLAACAGLAGRAPAVAVLFDDHARYRARDAARLAALGRRHGVKAWLTTAKDAVKLASLWPGGPPLLVVELEVEWPGNDALPDLVEERVREFTGKGGGRRPGPRP